MSLVLASAGARLLFSLMLGWVLIRVGHMLNLAERIGIGLMGGAGFMTTAVILDYETAHGTPFDVWAGALFTVGGWLFFSGFVHRKMGHERRNDEAMRQAQAHLQARGKL
jgi:hypothetical protein